jgi:cysteine desulfuration protein SufE
LLLSDALETLHLLPNWENRYGYILELAKVLPPFPAAAKIEANFVRGCTAQVWMTGQFADEKLQLNLCSDALIVQGLLGLVWLAFDGKTQAEVAATDLPALLANTQLLNHLSPNRRSGFVAVIAKVKAL